MSSEPFIPASSFGKESTDDDRDGVRLRLVLNLDNVLLHTTRFSDLSRQEQHQINIEKVSDQPSTDLFIDIGSNEVTKLRPLVDSFLKEASTMFELSIYTHRTRSYAARMVSLLDPERKYFGDRMIAKGDYTAGDVRGVKRLKAVLAKESCTLMMDVDARVCSNNNLLLIEPFNYFARNKRTYRDRWYPSKNPENKGDNYLADMVDVLKSIHKCFFSDNRKGVPADVRTVVASLRQNVLKGCVIYTGRPDTVTSMARQLGATIVPERSSAVTHVISEFPSRDYARWAMEKDKFLMHPDWVFVAYRMWKRPLEAEFWVKFPSKHRSLSCSI